MTQFNLFMHVMRILRSPGSVVYNGGGICQEVIQQTVLTHNVMDLHHMST